MPEQNEMLEQNHATASHQLLILELTIELSHLVSRFTLDYGGFNIAATVWASLRVNQITHAG